MTDEKQAFSQVYPLLNKIETPDDLKAMPREELDGLATEIRSFLVERVTENGGHLASNLGAVEMTLAIHRVFSTPEDHLIFDVGHQSYIHKLITGRRERFTTLRQGGGLSGFPKRSESEHDCFGTGHSSTSLSAALGFAEADRLAGSDAYTVCVIGDGAYTGGMIHEALNNCRKDLRLIIIINENEMSISKNIGRFAKELAHLRTTRGYIRTKQSVSGILSHIPLIGKPMVNGMKRAKIGMKAALYGSNVFENLGLHYLGPVDGNNEETVEMILQEAKASKQSCVIHLRTKKGKGYAEAEERPDKYHGMSPASAACKEPKITFSAAMGETLSELARDDEKICAITAAMADGTGLDRFAKEHKNRFFDVGIAEEHAVTFAAGLAANGYRPAVAIYSTFLQRAYDNIIHDVALQNLPVAFFVDRAGMNLADGPTHYGVFDVAFLSQIPNLTVYSPITISALKRTMKQVFASGKAAVIRYPNGSEDARVVEAFYSDPADERTIRADFHSKDEGIDGVIVTHGRIVLEAMKAKQFLAEQGKRVGILLLEQITPYAEVAAHVAESLSCKPEKLLLLEEEIRAGGMGMMLSAELKKLTSLDGVKTEIMALEDPFTVAGKGESCLAAAGLDAESIAKHFL